MEMRPRQHYQPMPVVRSNDPVQQRRLARRREVELVPDEPQCLARRSRLRRIAGGAWLTLVTGFAWVGLGGYVFMPDRTTGVPPWCPDVGCVWSPWCTCALPASFRPELPPAAHSPTRAL
jgi:hypothetical protein